MFRTGVRSVVTGISRMLDLMPEPLVLRALEVPAPSTRARSRS